MRLSRYTDIGLRALLYVGVREERVSAREVSDAFNVSRDHVTKSLQGLVSLGALTSAPGRNGGFTLDQDPGHFRLGQLIRKLEPSLALAECFTPHSTCPMTPSCELASALYEAQESFFESLDQYTVADLIERDRPALIQLSYDRAS